MEFNLKNKSKAIDYKFSAEFESGKQNKFGHNAMSQVDKDDLKLIKMFMDKKHKEFKTEEGKEIFAKKFANQDFVKTFGLSEDISNDVDSVLDARFRQIIASGDDKKAAAFMSIIIEKDLPLIIDSPITTRFVKYVNIGWTEKYEMRAKFNTVAKVVKKARSEGWTADKETLAKGGSIEVITDVYESKVYEEYIEFLKGNVSIVDLINSVNRGYEVKTKQLIYQALDENIIGSSTGFAENSADLKVLRTLINKTKADRRNAGYSKIVLIGSSEAFNQLTLHYDGGTSSYNTLFTEAQKSELLENGYLANLLGAEVILMDRFLDDDGTFPVNSDVISVMPLDSNNTEFIHLVTRGESITRLVDTPQQDENMQLSFERHDYMGVGVMMPPVVGKLTVPGVEITVGV